MKANQKTPVLLLALGLLVALTVILVNSDNPTGMLVYEKAQKISSCQEINSNSYVLLEDDLYSTTTCIVINSDNVIVDCAGHRIEGIGKGYGIKAVNKQNILIKNCEISGFEQELYNQNSDIRLKNNNFESVPVVTQKTGETGIAGEAFNFAKTPSGITFLIVVIAAGIFIVAAFVPKPEEDTEELDHYLIMALRRGAKPKEIKEELVKAGWDKDFIHKYISEFIENLREKRK